MVTGAATSDGADGATTGCCTGPGARDLSGGGAFGAATPAAPTAVSAAASAPARIAQERRRSDIGSSWTGLAEILGLGRDRRCAFCHSQLPIIRNGAQKAGWRYLGPR